VSAIQLSRDVRHLWLLRRGKNASNSAETGQMIGKYRDGGLCGIYGDGLRGAFFGCQPKFRLKQGAIMMCSSSTSLHAPEQGAVEARRDGCHFWAAGGSWAFGRFNWRRLLGLLRFFAVDIKSDKLALAQQFGRDSN